MSDILNKWIEWAGLIVNTKFSGGNFIFDSFK
jgi:hypothetical protein